MMKLTVIFSLLLLAAGDSQANLGETSPRLNAILLAECADVLKPEAQSVLDEARKRGLVGPFDPAWCVKHGLVPRVWKDGEDVDS